MPPGPLDEDAEPEMEPDFASEHATVTVADQLEGGPEGAPEPESPRGLSGQD
jgi:hypothetical protein